MNKRTVSIYISAQQLSDAADVATERGWTRNQALNHALRLGLRALREGAKPIREEEEPQS